MEGPFKMKGSSALGYGNQHSKGMKYASPTKKALVGDQANLPEHLKAKISAAPYASPAKNVPDMNDPKVKANYEKFKDNPEYREAMNRKAGGDFSYDAKTNTGYTKKQIKK